MFLLVLALSANLQDSALHVVEVHENPDKCLVRARQLNQQPQMNTPKALKAGAAFVCMSPLYSS